MLEVRWFNAGDVAPLMSDVRRPCGVFDREVWKVGDCRGDPINESDAFRESCRLAGRVCRLLAEARPLRVGPPMLLLSMPFEGDFRGLILASDDVVGSMKQTV